MKNEAESIDNKQDNGVLPCVMHWFDCSEKLPLCTETGDWDGKKSELIIGETITGKKFLGCCYEGFMDGNSFFDWYQVDEINHNDWLVNDTVVRWINIPF